ncbi:hypothetical protein K2Q16_04650 [Patescibacteria group bacterium]|nr:hypothetical protein [Patescibacteria group bacterium]
MKKNIKLFVATAELYQSPFIANLTTTCDAALTIGKEHLLQVALPDCRPDTHLELDYNPAMLELTEVKVETRKGISGCFLAIRTRGRELGHTFLTILCGEHAIASNVSVIQVRGHRTVTA